MIDTYRAVSIQMRRFIILLIITTVIFGCQNTAPDKTKAFQGVKKEPVTTYRFGFDTSKYKIVEGNIKNGETLGIILNKYHLSPARLYDVIMQIKDTFNVKSIKAGKPYTLFISKDSLQIPQAFVYQPNKKQYVVIDMRDSIVKTQFVKRKIIKKLKTASGIITGSLFENLSEQGINEVLALYLADIYAWTVDFYHIYRQDKFKVLYDELYVDDSISVGIGNIYAAYFEHNKKAFYAFRYLLDSTKGIPEYYDEEGRNLQKAFLKSPLKFGRVTSRYSRHRYLKYYGRVKPHLGTDFAAPIGTPIRSTANGVVVASSYTRGNGKYVKIKHNPTYSTQYLHMSRRAVNVGDVVKQGQIIGYIGMTGHTTGPHVCYRLWKNGKQIDALKEKFPDAKPMPDSIKSRYFSYIKPWKKKLDSIMYPEMRRDTVKSL